MPGVDQLLDDRESRDILGRVLALPRRALARPDNFVAALPDAQRLHGDTRESCHGTAPVHGSVSRRLLFDRHVRLPYELDMNSF